MVKLRTYGFGIVIPIKNFPNFFGQKFELKKNKI